VFCLLGGAAVGGGGGGGRGDVGDVMGLPGTGGGARLPLRSDVAELRSPPPKYDVRLAPGDCGVSRAGTGGAPARIGNGVSTPDVSADERLACIDISSSDSDPGPGESGAAAAGGGGGTGLDSVAGTRGVGLLLSLGNGGGAVASCLGGGGGTARSVTRGVSFYVCERDRYMLMSSWSR
jgi:hypothetical protein